MGYSSYGITNFIRYLGVSKNRGVYRQNINLNWTVVTGHEHDDDDDDDDDDD